MNDKLIGKNYNKFDRTFMAFGSIMNMVGNMLKGSQTDKKVLDGLVDWGWDKAKNLTSNLVDELYKDNGENDEKVL